VTANICTSGSVASSKRGARRTIAAAFVLLSAAVAVVWSADPRFYPDDPLWVDDDKAVDAAGVTPVEDLNAFDFVENTFVKPGEKRDVRAMNVNSLDEVPDSSWFTNRIGRREMSIAEIVGGRIASIGSRSKGGSCPAASRRGFSLASA